MNVSNSTLTDVIVPLGIQAPSDPVVLPLEQFGEVWVYLRGKQVHQCLHKPLPDLGVLSESSLPTPNPLL